MKVSATLLKNVSESPSVTHLNELVLHNRLVTVKGAAGSLKSVLLALFFEKVSNQIVYLTSDSIEAEGIKDDVQLFAGVGQVAFFPASDMYGFGLDLANDIVKGKKKLFHKNQRTMGIFEKTRQINDGIYCYNANVWIEDS